MNNIAFNAVAERFLVPCPGGPAEPIDDTLKAWTILLAILTFSLSLIGTFLVRSGVLTSVHAFASDPLRGVFILLLLGVATGGALLLFAIRAPSLQGGGLFAPISREGGLLLNNLLLTTAAATVLLGTLYPLFLDVISHEKVSVGPPFFNMTFVPIMIPLLAANGPNVIAAAPFLPPSWSHPFGTDDVGRDVFVRTFAGGRSDLLAATGTVLFSFIVGTVIGTAAG